MIQMLKNQQVQHHNHRIQFIQHPYKTHIQAHQTKIVGPVTAIQTQVALATACLINFTFQVDN